MQLQSLRGGHYNTITVLEETLVNFDQIIKWNQAHKLIFTNFKVLPVSFIHGKSTGTNIKANLKVF